MTALIEALQHQAPVEQTGQTQCWDPTDTSAPFEELDCSTAAARGQDGAVQAGVVPPNPRFTDNGDGTVTDNLTGLIWLQNADCFGRVLWQAALAAANTLTEGQCGLTDGSVAGDWRLPNVKELRSLIHFGFHSPALSNAAGTGHWTEGDAFSGVQLAYYWSSTTAADNAGFVWTVDLSFSLTTVVLKDYFPLNVWPVRGGQ